MHVPFPADFPRRPGLRFDPAVASAPLAPTGALGDLPPDPAWVLARLIALLPRYTDAPAIGLDVFGLDGAPRLVECLCDPERRLGDLAEEARRALQGPGGPAPLPTSNLAVTWGDQRQSPSLALPYELHFALHPHARSPSVAIQYDQSLFHRATIERLLGSLASALADHPGVDRIAELPILSPPARAEVLQLLDAGAPSETPGAFLERFSAVARERPEAIAARHLDLTLTYAELDQRATRLAAHLVQRGLGPSDVVAVCVAPGLEILVAILGLFKARLVYLPLDPTHPPAFLRHMLDEAQPRLVLLQSASAGLDCFASRPTLNLDQPLPAAPTIAPPSAAPAATLDDPAYVLFTSGTTGKPKGVLASHRNLAHFLGAARRAYGFRPPDVFTSIARYTFSISLFDLLAPLTVGASVRLLDRAEVLDPRHLGAVLEEATVVHAGPSLWATFFRFLEANREGAATYPNVRHVSSGGDLVPASVMEALKRVFPRAEVFTIYGCTEVSCMGTTFRVPRDRTVDRSYVGRPFPGVGLRLVDARRALVPLGVVGEICFSGPGLTSGYLGHPELDEAKFIELDGERFYRTGDLGRLHPDGSLEILGRRDDQIQLRGMRLELAGLENTVRELGLASQCAFVLHKDLLDERLVAFVVGAKDRDLGGFRRTLSTAVPESMLPQHLVLLEKMPLTPNGKLDRRALAALEWRTGPPTGGTPPRTEAERAVAEVFARLLDRPSVGVDQSFFELGGHSLLAVVAIHELSQRLGRPLPAQAFFEHPTVLGVLDALGERASSPERPILLNEHRGRPALFMVSGLHIYRPLARALEGRFACYGLFSRLELAPLEGDPAEHSVESLAQAYLGLVRQVQPHGPYRLLGYSFAGLVTYEMCQQLRRDGEAVDRLILVDALLPEWLRGWRFRVSQARRVFSARPTDLLRFGLRRLQGRPAPPALNLPRYQGDPAVGGFEAERDEVNAAAAARYFQHLSTYPGPSLVIASADRLRRDPLKSPSCGWAPFIPHLEAHQVPGDHFAMIERADSVAHIVRYIEAPS